MTAEGYLSRRAEEICPKMREALGLTAQPFHNEPISVQPCLGASPDRVGADPTPRSRGGRDRVGLPVLPRIA